MIYVRFEAATPNRRGRHSSMFGLANGLAHRGKLTPQDHAWLEANNHWIDEAYPDPGLMDSELFDKTINPTATCWFKATEAAEPLLARIPEHLPLLDRYGVAWRERRRSTVGPVLYEDPIQVITSEHS